MWNQGFYNQAMANISIVKRKRRRRRRRPNYRVGRFQCSVCLRRFPEKYRLLDHQRSTCHTGINDLDSDNAVSDISEKRGLLWAFGGMNPSLSTDIYAITCYQLESFIAEKIQADSLFKTCCGEVINQLVRRLQDPYTPVKLRPRRIIKSGSLGKGTAVRGRADVDLVMMLTNYENVRDLLEDLDDVLNKLENYLVSKTTASHLKTTRYSVQVEVTCTSGHKHEVDILPAVDLLGLGCSPEEVYKKMERVSANTVHEYSVTLAPLQLEIIGALPTKVKSLIKLIKYWKGEKLKERNEPEMPSFAEKRSMKPNWPNSYALELVVISAWSEAKMPTNFDMVRALHAVLTSLVNHRNFKVVLAGQMKYNKARLKSRSPPFIMDPANPFNDMYHGLVGGEAYDWDSVVPEARRWLGKALFDGVSDTESSW